MLQKKKPAWILHRNTKVILFIFFSGMAGETIINCQQLSSCSYTLKYGTLILYLEYT